MSVAIDSEKDHAAAVAPPIRPTAPWRVVSVEALPDYRLHVRFHDGLEGVIHMKELVQSSAAGVFEALRDPAVFAGAHVVLGAVSWPGELDLAPDAMYDEIQTRGEWVLR